MSCFGSFCFREITQDSLIILSYGAAVAIMLGAAFSASSRTLRRSASMIAIAWLITIACFLSSRGVPLFAEQLALDVVLACLFRRMARFEIFPAILCVLFVGEAIFIAAGLAAALDPYWIMFTLNRVFELTLVFITGCSLFRIAYRKSRPARRKSSAADRMQYLAA